MTVVDLYTIQIVRDNTIYPGGLSVGMNLDDAADLMPEIEENLTLLLPAGFRARIRRWDHPDPDEQTEPFVPDRYPDDTSPEALRAAGWRKRGNPDEGNDDE